MSCQGETVHHGGRRWGDCWIIWERTEERRKTSWSQQRERNPPISSSQLLPSSRPEKNLRFEASSLSPTSQNPISTLNFFIFFLVTGGCISIIKSSHHKVIYLPPTPPPPQYHHSSTPSITYSLGGQSSFQDEAVAKLQNDHCYFTLFLINTFHPSDIHFQLPAITWHTHTFTEHPHTDQNPYLFFLQGYHQKQHQRSLQGWVQSWADALATLLVKENQTKDTHRTENAENGQIFPSACFMWLYCQ